jgi:hypothetical protein
VKKQISVVVVAFLISLAQIQCKKDNLVNPPVNNPTVVDNIINVQDKNDILLTSLLAIKDTASALDSLLKVYLRDSTVASGVVSSQGISVLYKNGVKGGIMIDPEDGYPLLYKSYNKDFPFTPADIKDFSPSSKKTIFINPSYLERKAWADPIIALYNNLFPKNGYNPPVLYLDTTATVDLFTNLAGYGIIHIYSHGWAWPDKWHLTEVYLLTGETANAVTTNKYQNEILGGNIPLIKIHKKTHKYFISPSFFSNRNNFEKDSTIVYGGFCFGFLGGWPNAVLDVSKAGAYTGFTWRVLTDKNANWAKSLFDTLSNNNVKVPNSLDYWFTKTPGIAKQYYDSQDKVTVKIVYTGHSDLTLVPVVEISISPNPAPAKPNESITFTAKSKNKLPSQTKYKWNFGDGSAEQTILNDSTVTHSFANEGTFPVTVKLLNQTDKQLAAASSQAVISAGTVTPKFTSLNVEISLGSINSWTAIGKYHPTDAWGWELHILRDTSYSGSDTSSAGISIFHFPITMSDNSFTGYRKDTLYYYGDSAISIWSFSGSYDPIAKTASIICNYSSSGTAVYKTYTVTSSFSCAANGVPIYNQQTTYYYFESIGLAACNYASGVTYNYVMDPIPPLGVTDSGIKLTKNLTSFWCSAGSKVSISLSAN